MKANGNRFKVIFHLRVVTNDSNIWAVYARITINKKRIELSTRQSIKKESWDENNGMAYPINKECKQLNDFLDQLKGSYLEAFREMLFLKITVNTENFKRVFFKIESEEEKHTLLSLLNYHNIELKESLSWGTMKNYFTTQKYLVKFLKAKRNLDDIGLKQINYKLIIDFEYYLKTYVPSDHQKRIGNNGVMKHMERFRKLTNLALKNEWIEKDPFKAYRLKFERFERGYLTEEELMELETKQFKIERLQAVRDLFIFSCYTGLSYIDAVSLTKLNIKKGIDQKDWLVTTRAKTTTPVIVPLLPPALEIINKYSCNIKCLSDGTLLPKISNQKLNGYLKEIAQVCNIEKNITFHLARHTFATTVTLSNGVSIESVSKMLGHTKISTTQVYARVVEKKISNEMSLLSEKLFSKDQYKQV